MYQQFNIQQLYVLLTKCIFVLFVGMRTAIISLYSINRLIFITETYSASCAVRLKYVYS